ncbi:hypothetical protein FG379_001209 [Cryptosporidium bovis]|uniref:uncharacterized protein n=1 Tax=Cryptosporidium bovis TaxID=310047 RepID=UPI00351A679C|nr:hypothetical protein FG379_001209 [Cryptosporidium bovis]
MENLLGSNNSELVPECKHCKLEFIKKKSRSLLPLVGFNYETKNYGKGATLYSIDTIRNSCKNGPIIGRLVHSPDGRIFLLQYYFSNSTINGNENPLYSLVLCEVSGKFNASDFLKCSRTKYTFVSCWVIIKDWNLIKVDTHDSGAPIRSKLLRLHFDPSCILSKESTKNRVKISKDSIFCFEACSISWISKERILDYACTLIDPYSSIKNVPELYKNCINVVGAVLHISEIVRYEIGEQIYKYKKKQKTNIKNYEIDVYFKSILDHSIFGSSFSALIRPINAQKDLVVFFPDSNHMIMRYVLGWENIYQFENVLPGSVLVHSPIKEPREKKCVIAIDSTSVRIQVSNLSRFILSNNIYGNNYPVFVQINRILGFGTFELNTKNKPIRLFLHNSGFHQTYIGSSLTKGSVLWIRNPRKIVIESPTGTSIFIGIAVESYSDWGLQSHSKFKKNRNYDGTIWKNQPLHIQIIGYEFLELSGNDLNENKFCSFLYKVSSYLDIRNYCYYHFSLYVDIFNIIGIPKSANEGISILLLRILSLSEHTSPVILLKDSLNIVFLKRGRKINVKSELLCSKNEMEIKTRITHPSQTVEVRSEELSLISIKCCKLNEFWRLVEIDEWVKLFDFANSNEKFNSINMVTSKEILTFERLFSIIHETDTPSALNNEKCVPYDNYVFSESTKNDVVSSICTMSTTEYSQDYIGLCGNFLVEIVLNKYMESNYWINNLFFVKTPKNQNLRKNIYPLFVETKCLSNSRIYQVYCNKKLLFIKKAYIRLLGSNNRSKALFANESDITLICIQDPLPSIMCLPGLINTNEGLLLYVNKKKTMLNENRSEIEFYFQCLPCFLTQNRLNNNDSLNLSLLIDIKVPSNWYFKINSSRFIMITKKQIIDNQQIILDEKIERVFLHQEYDEHLFFVKELSLPFSNIENIVDNEITKGGIVPGVKIVFPSLPDEFLFWSFSAEQPLFIKYDKHLKICKREYCSKPSVLELKFWIDRIVTWSLFQNENQLIYGSTLGIISELKCLRERDELFVCNNLKNNGKDVQQDIIISFIKVRIIDIIRFTGFNPKGIHGNWTILRVTSMHVTWNSGWIDLWLSEIDIRSKSIHLLVPGEVLSISDIMVVSKKQVTPPLSPTSYVFGSIISGIISDHRQDKAIYYNQECKNGSSSSIGISEIPLLKNDTSASIRGRSKTNYGKTLSIFNNGAIAFRTAIKNSRIDLDAYKRVTKSDEIFNFLLFSVSQSSEVNLLSGLKYECGENNLLSKIPNPYVLAPDGSPVTCDFIKYWSNNKDVSLIFNKLYCIENEHSGNEFRMPIEYVNFFNDCNSNINLVVPDETITVCGSILQIEQIEMGWFCLKCLRLLNSVTICSCGVDHKSVSTWKSLSIYLVGTVEIMLDNSKSKLFPFAMTNWNALKLLVYSGMRNRIHLNPSNMYNSMIKFSNAVWNYMESSGNSIGTRTLYMYGETCEALNSLFSSTSSTINCSNEGNNFQCLDDVTIPVGVIGDYCLLDDDKNVIASIPNDPIGNIEFEICIRFTNSNEIIELNKSSSEINAYIHVLRWRIKDTIRELENEVTNIKV